MSDTVTHFFQCGEAFISILRAFKFSVTPQAVVSSGYDFDVQVILVPDKRIIDFSYARTGF